MKINNPERYCRKFKEDFEIVKRKLITKRTKSNFKLKQ